MEERIKPCENSKPSTELIESQIIWHCASRHFIKNNISVGQRCGRRFAGGSDSNLEQSASHVPQLNAAFVGLFIIRFQLFWSVSLSTLISIGGSQPIVDGVN